MKIDSTSSKPLNYGVKVNLSSIDNYVTSAMRMPMLSHERELELGYLVRDKADHNARNELVESHLKLANSIARQYVGFTCPFADLVQAGNIGLLKAADRFDPAQNVRFASYAIPWIKSEISDFVIRNSNIVRFFTTKNQRKLYHNIRRYMKYDRTMTTSEIAACAIELNVREEDVRDVEQRILAGEVSLDVAPQSAMMSDGKDHDDFVHSFLADSTAEPTQVLHDMRVVELHTNKLWQHLEKLNERERYIVEQRYLVNDEGAGVPLREMADKYNISCERVRQIEVAALKKLKTHMADDYEQVYQ